MLSLLNDTRPSNNREVDRGVDPGYPNSMGGLELRVEVLEKPTFPPPMTKTRPSWNPMILTIVKKKL